MVTVLEKDIFYHKSQAVYVGLLFISTPINGCFLSRTHKAAAVIYWIYKIYLCASILIWNQPGIILY